MLETPKQLAARVGLKQRAIRSLISSGKLEFVMIGCRVHIPEGAFERFIEQNRVTKCQDGTAGLNCTGVPSVNNGSSPGQMAVAANARLVRQTANKLKSSSRNGFK